MDNYQIVPMYTKNAMKRNVIAGYKVVNRETGETVKSWSSRSGEGEGVFRGRRIENARKNAEKYLQSLQKKQSLAGDEAQYNPKTGLYTTADGKSYESLEEARRANEELKRQGLLDTAKAESQQSLAELESLIKGSGARQKALAERVGARQQGQLLSQLERSILGSGGDAQTLDALVPEIQEQGERSLLDRVQGIEASTLGRLTQVPQLELGNITDMAQLGQTQQRISDARTQALMNEETQRAQIQATLDNQPEWWESILGAAGTALGSATGTYLGGKLLGTGAAAGTGATAGTGAAAGTGATTAATVAPVVSDIRVKENISQVGLLDNGLPVYLFNYKGNKTPQIGLMAQDVEKVNKDAVVEIDGIKRVYYGKAVK